MTSTSDSIAASPPHVTAITLGVADVALSTTFYTDGLGFPLISRLGDEIAFVQAGYGLVLALWRADQLPTEYGDVGRGPSDPPLSLGHNVATSADVAAHYQRALDAGARAIAPPTVREWGGTSACVADPDGFRWDFVYNPTFRIAEDGEVTVV